MDDFYQRKWEGEELDRELLAQITLAVETLQKIVWLSGPSVVWLEQAITAYKEALKERTHDRAPLDWAHTQNNLGLTLGRLGERENRTDRLELAVTAYKEALKEQIHERAPLDWAQTQNNLGIALYALGERENRTDRPFDRHHAVPGKQGRAPPRTKANDSVPAPLHARSSSPKK
jgi:tetratricopeptide (TPR) repeat protein